MASVPVRCSPVACGVLAFLVTGAGAWPAAAQPLAPDVPKGSIDQLVADFVPDALTRFRVAGSSIAIVDRGRIRTMAFGVADPATGAPIDPATTRFHVASVTKLLTAIAVVQLAEAGRLRLDDPVSAYLPADLAESFSRPDIRIRDLLTHTGGLQDRWVGMASTTPDGVWALDTYLRSRLAPRAEPPGRIARYSNYGYTLAGYVVERVSGRPYAAYITEHVLGPIDASGSYVGPRPPDSLDAAGFFYRESITVEPRVYEHTVPAGGVHAPVADVARIVAAVIGDGSFDGRRLLSAEGARALRQPQFTPDPRLPGVGFGLYGYGDAAEDNWIAGGELPGLSTRVLLMPRDARAVIVAVNRKDPSLAMALFDKIRAAGGRQPAASSAPDAVAQASRLPEGRFRATLDDPRSFLKFAALFAPEVTVAPQPGAALAVHFGNADRADDTWRPGGGDLWLDGAGHPVAHIGRDAAGRVSHISVSDTTAGLVTFLPITWWQTPGPTLAVMAAAALTSVLTVLTWAGWWRRGAGRRVDPALRAPLLATAIVTLLFLAGFVTGLAQLAVLHDDRFAFGLPWWFAVVLTTPLAIVATLAWLAARWRSRTNDAGALTSAAVAAWTATTTLALLGVAWYWNLIGPRT